MPAVLHEGNQLGVGYPAMQANQLGPLGQLAMLVCYCKQHLLQHCSRQRISTSMFISTITKMRTTRYTDVIMACWYHAISDVL